MGREKWKKNKFFFSVWLEGFKEGKLIGLGVFFPYSPNCFLRTLERKLDRKWVAKWFFYPYVLKKSFLFSC